MTSRFKNYYRALDKFWKRLIGGCFFLVFAALLFALFFLRVYYINGKTSYEIGDPKDSLVALEVNNFARRYIPFFKENNFARPDKKVGWITDIHADRFKHRDVDSGMIYPRQYSYYLPKVFNALEAQGIDTVIATGDNTNSGDDNYAMAIEKIAQEKHMRVIWVKGNHDNPRVMATLGVAGSQYYYVDYGNTRIIVLDDVESQGDYQGYVDSTQINWLKGALKTQNQVIVAMHIPIFNGNASWSNIHNLSGGFYANVGDLLSRYIELENVLKTSGNVKMVLSGHWHVPWTKTYDGINYYGQAALSRIGYSGAYGVIDLKNDSVNYEFAP
ncbi:MAG: metallophosphoesterase [Candidatus Pacebacteria bacterium]|nr:metallophosphoesterase [Candidatus Paceibacterota bacterium]MDR3583481.1 metallophosphoesterase [Candidatus Paceibacterota bacterium]